LLIHLLDADGNIEQLRRVLLGLVLAGILVEGSSKFLPLTRNVLEDSLVLHYGKNMSEGANEEDPVGVLKVGEEN
jgi:hypothetical protein